MDHARVPNLLLRQARRAQRETQQQTAEAVGARLGCVVEPEYISRLERGVVTWPHTWHREALRAHFGVASDAELGFYCRRSVCASEAEDVKRRVFVSSLPLAAIPAIPAGAHLAELINVGVGEPTPVPRRVGSEHVEQVRTMVAQAKPLDLRFGGGFAREVLAGQLRWAVGLLDAHMDHSVWAALHSAVGELAVVTAWSSHDLGANGAAQRCYQVALHCAEQADDWDIHAETRSEMARIAQYSGDGETALTLAHQSMVRSDRLTALRRACLVAVEARAHGRRGDADACLAAVRRAEDQFAAADPANETPAMAAFFGPAQLAGDTGNALWPLAMRGLHVQTTAERLRTAADSYPVGYVRARTLGLTRLALLTFTQGDPEQAVATATEALDGAGSVHSQRVTADLVELRRVAWQHRTAPGVAALRKRVTATLAAA